MKYVSEAIAVNVDLVDFNLLISLYSIILCPYAVRIMNIISKNF